MSGRINCVHLVVLYLLQSMPGVTSFAQTDAVKTVASANQKETTVTSFSSILAKNTLYVSAQTGHYPDRSLPKNFRQEVAQALRNVHGVLHTEGMDFKDLASINIFVKDAKNIDPMNEVYWRVIGNDAPARTILVVGNLPNAANIQINAVAVRTGHRQAIYPKGWPSGDHHDPPGLQVDDVLYLSAQSGVNPLTKKLPIDFGSEVKQALDNVGLVLKSANMSMANVVWVNPYMSGSGSQEHVMNKIYATYFELGNAPGRGTFTVAHLPNGSHIIFTCVAGADLSKRKAIRPRNERVSATASPGVLYGDTLYLSAKDAFVPGLGIISPDLDIQTKLSMRNLLDGLQEADMDFSNVVSSTVYLRNIKDGAQFDALYRDFFKKGLPTQTVLQENLDVKDIDTEQVSFIAVRSPAVP